MPLTNAARAIAKAKSYTTAYARIRISESLETIGCIDADLAGSVRESLEAYRPESANSETAEEPEQLPDEL